MEGWRYVLLAIGWGLDGGEQVTPIAHFTAAELPGTLAVLVFGIVIGAAAVRRRTDALTLAILGFCGLAALGSVLDHFKGVSTAWRTGADAAFLLSGLVLLVVFVMAREAGKSDQQARSGRRRRLTQLLR